VKGASAKTADGADTTAGHVYKVFPDGSRYEGQWVEGSKHGQGKFIYPDGDIYEGTWIEGKAHGFGTYTSKQSKYVGDWQNDLKHGHAIEEWDDTSKYSPAGPPGLQHLLSLGRRAASPKRWYIRRRRSRPRRRQLPNGGEMPAKRSRVVHEVTKNDHFCQKMKISKNVQNASPKYFFDEKSIFRAPKCLAMNIWV